MTASSRRRTSATRTEDTMRPPARVLLGVGVCMLVVCLLAGLDTVHGQEWEPVPRLSLWNPGRMQRADPDDASSLTVSPTVLETSNDPVTLSWTFSGTLEDGEQLFLAVFSPPDSIDDGVSYPVKYEYVEAIQGELQWRMTNIREDYVAGLFRGPSVDEPTLVAQSESFGFQDPNEPRQAHLALTGVEGEMRVTWITRDPVRGALRYRQQRSSSSDVERAARVQSKTYTRDMLCGNDAGNGGFHSPGYINSAIMTDLKFGEAYEYTILGGGDSQTTRTLDFINVASHDDGHRLTAGSTIAVLGDLGTAEVDGSTDYSRTEQPAARATTQLLVDALDAPERLELVFHIGDVSYARGFEAVWDEFGEQMEPVASAVPYQTLPGNHERDANGTSRFMPHRSYYQNDNSGGECGVAYGARYIMPAPADAVRNDQPWYVFQHAQVTHVALSSEHDLREDSAQYDWLVNTLAAVDRDATPWLVVSMHRPMYVDSTYGMYDINPRSGSDQSTARSLRASLEPLFQEHEVDLVLAGHHHSYQRTCHVYAEKCLGSSDDSFDNSKDYTAPVYIVAGMAGYSFSDNLRYVPPAYTEFVNNEIHGALFLRSTPTTLETRFIANGPEHRVIDRLVLVRSSA